jgi:hypothetical protein
MKREKEENELKNYVLCNTKLCSIGLHPKNGMLKNISEKSCWNLQESKT